MSIPRSPWTNRSQLALLLFICAALVSRLAHAENNVEWLPATPDTPQEALLLVDINQQRLDETVLMLRGPQGEVLVSGEDLSRWRLRRPEVAPTPHLGALYYPLAAIRGLLYRVDEAQQTLVIEAPPAAFLPTTGSAAPDEPPVPDRPSPGMFLNYDLLAEQADGITESSGLIEAGLFTPHGIGISNFVVRDLGSERDWTRLDTTWTIDYPDKLASLRLGDAITRSGAFWGGAVRFGGVQYGTNFATRPGLITFPLQAVKGQAVLPSTVDIYVNNIRTAHQAVPPGPFSINELPVISGSGEVRIVVTDLLGREQVITQPFYATPQLLKTGLDDFSYEVGLVREDFGLASNNYGNWLAAGTWRRGLSDRFTSEVHAELQQDHAALGIGAVFQPNTLGIFSGSLAASHTDGRDGYLLALGFDHQGRVLTFGINNLIATRDFKQLGFDPLKPAPRRTTTAALGISTNGWGTFGLGYTYTDDREQSPLETLSARYNTRLGEWGQLDIFAFKTLSEGGSDAITATLTVPLGHRTTAAVSHKIEKTGQGRSSEWTASLQQSLPPGPGFGYRLEVNDQERQEAALAARTRIGTYTLEADRVQGQTSTRLGVSGGLAVIGGSAFLTRRITDSFGVVQVPGYDGIRVYQDNQLVGRTDEDGNILLTRLRAYEYNPVKIEQQDLPLDAEVDALQLNAVPYFRSGLTLGFPIRRSRGALFTILLGDGQPVPAGATLQIVGKKATFPVALGGETYVTGLEANNVIRVNWRGQSCEIAVAFPEGLPDPLPHLGQFVCEGVQP